VEDYLDDLYTEIAQRVNDQKDFDSLFDAINQGLSARMFEINHNE
jgi:hypothetical protein